MASATPFDRRSGDRSVIFENSRSSFKPGARLFVANETDDVRRTRPFAKPRDKNVACVQALLRNGVIVWPADPAGSPQVFAVANVSVEKETGKLISSQNITSHFPGAVGLRTTPSRVER